MEVESENGNHEDSPAGSDQDIDEEADPDLSSRISHDQVYSQCIPVPMSWLNMYV